LEKIKVEHIVHKVKEINRKLGLVSHRNMLGERSVPTCLLPEEESG